MTAGPGRGLRVRAQGILGPSHLSPLTGDPQALRPFPQSWSWEVGSAPLLGFLGGLLRVGGPTGCAPCPSYPPLHPAPPHLWGLAGDSLNSFLKSDSLLSEYML